MPAGLQIVAWALFLWWFCTGAILWLDSLPRHTFRYTLAGASLLYVAALAGINASAAQDSVAGAWCAFTCGLLAWAWHEVTFYTGWLTGPRQQRCAEGCWGWRHFGHAIQASLWHELAIVASAAAIAWLVHGQANPVALWTFLVLWAMHQSAKLNVFLGVPNLNEHMLPAHLDFLRGFLRQRPMNLLFPLSITLSCGLFAWLAHDAARLPADSPAQASSLFVLTLLALGILEHWFLVLPLPFAALWNGWLRSEPGMKQAQVDLVAGFLGAGKTTVMRRLLAEVPPGTRVLVLANDFSDLGIDGSLLSGRGAEVVELSNGCICCSLRQDLERQLLRLARRYQPARVLIEPSGVADVAALVAALQRAPLAGLVARLNVLTVVDAAAFLGDYARLPAHFEAQARVAPLVLVNKTDLVHEGSLEIIRHTLLAANPAARMVLARHGMPDEGRRLSDLLLPLSPLSPQASPDAPRRFSSATRRAPGAARWLPSAGEAGLGLQSWSTTLSGVCDPVRLHGLLPRLASGQYGQLERVKGIVRVGDGWLRFDLAGGRPAMSAHAACAGELPRVMAIGRCVDGPGLLQAFLDCTQPGALQDG